MQPDSGVASNPIAKEEDNIAGVLKEVETLRKLIETKSNTISRLKELIRDCHAQVCNDSCKVSISNCTTTD